ISKYFVLEYPNWVNTIAITKNGKFVLVKQYRHAINETSYELCAGVADKEGETEMEAAKRELKEETGYTGGKWIEWMRMAPNPATSNNWVYCFVATDVEEGETAPEPSEDISVHLHSLKEIIEMINDGRIIQGTHLTPLWKYIALNR
ncbi:MAG TPA: NUDIX hydrolase, partial [Flavipsychrobacter sp.]|nr:NUDIX hydrolase [Flavipsychrobacter sp.]